MSMSNSSARPRLWIIVFISSFLGLMVDAMDIQMLALSLPQLKEEFNMEQYSGWFSWDMDISRNGYRRSDGRMDI